VFWAGIVDRIDRLRNGDNLYLVAKLRIQQWKSEFDEKALKAKLKLMK